MFVKSTLFLIADFFSFEFHSVVNVTHGTEPLTAINNICPKKHNLSIDTVVGELDRENVSYQKIQLNVRIKTAVTAIAALVTTDRA